MDTIAYGTWSIILIDSSSPVQQWYQFFSYIIFFRMRNHLRAVTMSPVDPQAGLALDTSVERRVWRHRRGFKIRIIKNNNTFSFKLLFFDPRRDIKIILVLNAMKEQKSALPPEFPHNIWIFHHTFVCRRCRYTL